MKEQIEKMACEKCLHHLACLTNSEYVPTPCPAYEDKAGYRKQEWISVDERLPDDKQMCLAYATVYFVPDHVDDCDYSDEIIVTRFYKEFGFMDFHVHFWMPLPEAPKMKGEKNG